MEDRNVSLEELSELTGVSQVNLSRIRCGKIRALRFTTSDAICKSLQCNYGDILVYVPDDEVKKGDVVCYNASEDHYLEDL